MNYLKENKFNIAIALTAIVLVLFGIESPFLPVLFSLATLQLSVPARNAMLDSIETTIGTAPIIELRAGAMPANCAAASTGALLSRDAIPSDWLAAAVAGVKSKSGTWTLTGLAGITTSNIGYFRVYEASSPDTCHIQGDVTATGGGGAMTVDNISLAAGQVATVNSFALTAPNA